MGRERVWGATSSRSSNDSRHPVGHAQELDAILGQRLRQHRLHERAQRVHGTLLSDPMNHDDGLSGHAAWLPAAGDRARLSGHPERGQSAPRRRRRRSLRPPRTPRQPPPLQPSSRGGSRRGRPAPGGRLWPGNLRHRLCAELLRGIGLRTQVTQLYSVIVATGSYNPTRRVPNSDFLQHRLFVDYGKPLDPGDNPRIISKFQRSPASANAARCRRPGRLRHSARGGEKPSPGRHRPRDPRLHHRRPQLRRRARRQSAIRPRPDAGGAREGRLGIRNPGSSPTTFLSAVPDGYRP